MSDRVTHVAARLWFNKKQGNTYHSVCISYLSGRQVRSGCVYGYGTQYLETAQKLCEHTTSLRDLIARDIVCSDIVDVARKCDLHCEGDYRPKQLTSHVRVVFERTEEGKVL